MCIPLFIFDDLKGVFFSAGQISFRHGGAVLSSRREEEGQWWWPNQIVSTFVLANITRRQQTQSICWYRKQNVYIYIYKYNDNNYSYFNQIAIFFLLCLTEAWDPRLPVWKDQLWVDERALHHTQWSHLQQKRHWRAPPGKNRLPFSMFCQIVLFPF